MEALAILGIVGIFVLGVGTAIWLMAKAVMAFFSPPTPVRHTDPYAACQPAPIPQPPLRPVGADRPTPRAEVLSLMRRELMRAFNTGQIGKTTYLDMRRYVDQERALLDGHASLNAEPQAAASPAVVAVEPAPVAQADVQPMRSPEQMRSAIAKLHADAAAPEIPSLPPIVSSQKEEVAPSAAGAVSATPKQPLWERIVERLFTPENVRILQSLAICLIFTSAVALVRQQMWSQASAWAQLGILIAGTSACSAVGFALRRWTGLRITALCFLMLGQLSILLDAYAALIGTDGRGVYPYSPSSLWTICFVLFAATALCQARALKEPLFEAFAFFGALAAWGAGALWCGVNHWLLPAAFIPAALLCGVLSRWLRPAFAAQVPSVQENAAGGTLTLQRWSLPWWLDAAWEIGSGLLSIVLPVAAIGHITELLGCGDTAQAYWAHAGGMVALAAGLLLNACRKGHGRSVHVGAALLLVIWPLAEYAFQWPWEAWSMSLALPGAALALAGLFCERFVERFLPRERNAAFGASLANWGLAATITGVSMALCARLAGLGLTQAAWSSGAGLAVAVAFARLRNAPWAPWLATACAAFLASARLDIAGTGYESWPVAWLALALIAYAAWTFLARERDVAAHGRAAADALAVAAFAQLVAISPIMPNTIAHAGVPLSLSAGWIAAAGYALVTSVWERGEWRRGLGVILLSPALVYALYHAGFAFAGPAAWLAALAILVVAGASAVEARAKSAPLFYSAMQGAALICAHGVCLAASRWMSAEHMAATQAFGLLALAMAVIVTRLRAYWSAGEGGLDAASALPVLVAGETVALALLALAGECQAAYLAVHPAFMPIATTLIAALVVLVALAAEKSTVFCTRAKGRRDENERPFHAAGGIVALLLTATTLAPLWGASTAPFGPALLITLTWSAALLPLFLAVRGRLVARASDGVEVVISVLGFALAGMFAATAARRAVDAQFWLTATPANLRAACALFFGAMLALSVLCGWWLKRAFAPMTGMLALLGLAGCAYGAWHLPPESFGVCCALLGWLASAVAVVARKNGAIAASNVPASLQLSGAGIAAFAAVYLLRGLCVWPAGAAQSWAVCGWVLLAAWAWVGSGRAAALSLGAGLAVAVAACHAMRWLGLDASQFGPGLAAVALLLLALRELAAPLANLLAIPVEEEMGGETRQDAEAAMRPRLNGILGATLVTAFGSLLFAWVAGLGHQEWRCCVTLLENALLAVALSVAARRAGRSAGALLFLLEMSGWTLLAIAVAVAASPGAGAFPLSQAGWILVAALFLVVGMALESIVAGLAQAGATPAPQQSVPFLESRHVAAFGLTLLGLAQTLCTLAPFNQPAIQVTWRAILCAAALAVYGSLARSSADALRTDFARKLSAFAAYVVLLPAGYLCLLSAHATGSSWGALYFLALVPLLLGAAYILEHEKLAAQACQALFGAGLVTAGAAVLAFAGNRGCLAAVPCVTLAAIAMELLVLRAWRPLVKSEARASAGVTYTFGACLTLIGAASYGLRALAGWPAWGEAAPWAWQMPCLTALGLAMTVLGGAWGLEPLPASNGRGERNSVVALCGAWLSVLTLGVAFVRLVYCGMQAPYLHATNMAYLDALIVSILLSAGTALAAGRWLRFSAARYVAPMCVLVAYALSVWKSHPQAWEWYSLPTSLFLFIWAWQAAREEEAAPGLHRERQHEVTGMLALASLLALVPSFIQALPHTPEATWHLLGLLLLSLGIVIGAMLARRKVPLLAGSSALVLGTVVKAIQWAQHREALLPVVGIALGFGVLAIGTLFEQRMNEAIRKAVDRARAQAHMFWVSWQ